MQELDEAFDSFANLLKERTHFKIPTTEDAVRYLFFHTMTHHLKISPNDMLLESPHPDDKKQKVDMIISSSETRPELAFEFKFHRCMKKTNGRTTHAGQLFNDVFRLAMYKKYKENSRCFVVYATDSTMMNYFCNQENNLDDFFNLDVDKSLHIGEIYVKNHAPTFIDNCKTVYDCDVSTRLNMDFDNLYVRIFEVKIPPVKN